MLPQTAFPVELAAKEDKTNKNQPGGYVGIDGDGVVVGTFLARQDIAANLAVVVGELGQVVYATDTGKYVVGNAADNFPDIAGFGSMGDGGACIYADRMQLSPGGNTRGAHSVDLQSQRGDPAEVAHGLASVLIGGANCASLGANSVCLAGDSNSVYGNDACVLGGYNCIVYCDFGVAAGYTCYSWGSYGVSMGTGSVAGGAISFALGSGCQVGTGYDSYQNFTRTDNGVDSTFTISGDVRSMYANGDSVVLVDLMNGATVIYEITAGVIATVSFSGGNTTFTMPGLAHGCTDGAVVNTAWGTGSHARGAYAKVVRPYTDAWSSGGSFGQHVLTTLGAQTTDATAAEMTIGSAALAGTVEGTSSRYIIPSGKAVAVTLTVIGKQASSANVYFYKAFCVISNIAGTMTLSAITALVAESIPSGWGAIGVTADSTNKSLKVVVTGKASTSIHWQATVEGQEVSD